MEVKLETPGASYSSSPDFNAYRFGDFDTIIEHWIPLTHALNSLNRSMGLPDLYPFSLPQPALDKLDFVHAIVQANRRFDVGYEYERDVDRYTALASLFYMAGRYLLNRFMRTR